MGTNAVFFFVVNVSKIPLLLAATAVKTNLGFEAVDAQMMNATTFMLTLFFAPGLLVGAFVGRRLYRAIPERFFVPFVLILNMLTALQILISAALG